MQQDLALSLFMSWVATQLASNGTGTGSMTDAYKQALLNTQQCMYIMMTEVQHMAAAD